MNAIQLPTERMTAATDGPIGWMTFNNPKRRNAVSPDMWEAIPLILDRFEADPDIRVIVLRGTGEEAFVSASISRSSISATPRRKPRRTSAGCRRRRTTAFLPVPSRRSQ